MSWDFENGDIDPFFRRLSDIEINRWKADYERIIKKNDPANDGDKAKTPWMLPAWSRGLEMVNKIINERNIASKQNVVFKQMLIE